MPAMTADDVLARYLNEDLPDFTGLAQLTVNQQGRFENYPLNVAATRGSVEEVQALLAGRADVRNVGDMGNLALHDAIDSGNVDIIRLLLQADSPVDVRNEFDQTPQALAAASADPAVRALFSAPPGS
jgi:ankyrin repeat protein